MKKIITLIVLISFTISVTSCKSIKKVNCDAYGYNNSSEDVEFDIQKINQESTSKYVTTFSIK